MAKSRKKPRKFIRGYPRKHGETFPDAIDATGNATENDPRLTEPRLTAGEKRRRKTSTPEARRMAALEGFARDEAKRKEKSDALDRRVSGSFEGGKRRR